MKAFIEAALPWVVMGIYVAVIVAHGRGKNAGGATGMLAGGGVGAALSACTGWNIWAGLAVGGAVGLCFDGIRRVQTDGGDRQ